MENDDPLCLAGLEPSAISAEILSKSKSKLKAPSELEIKKEERLNNREQRLGSKFKASTPKEGIKAVPAPEKPVDVSALLDRISAYRERFPHLKSRNAKLSAKSTAEEVLDELHYLELQLGSQMDGSVLCKAYVASLNLVETTSQSFNPLGLQLQGLGQVASDNEHKFGPLIDELMIKYATGFYMGPEMRLLCLTAGLMYTVHQANTGNPAVLEALSKANQSVKAPPNSSDL